MRGSRAISVTVALAGGIVLLVLVLRQQLPYLLAHHWRGQLATTADERCRQLLGEIGALGEAGIPVLVEAIGSSRECVARGAREVLEEHFDRWLTLPPGEVAPKLLILARALAERIEGFGPTARRDAAELATWVLRWRPDGEAVDRASLIAACRKVLDAAAPYEPSEDDATQLAMPAIPSTGATSLAMPPGVMRDLGAANSVADLAQLPGGGLGVDALPVAEGPPALLEPSGPIVSQVDPEATRGSGNRASPETVALGPLRLDEGRAEGGDLPASGAPMQRDGARQSGSSLSEVAVVGSGHPAPDLVGIDTLELMRRLRTSGGDALARIRAELARRGFSEVHLALAVQLFDPDPEIRVETARRLPELQSIDAVPWLLWLCEDANAEVRLTAVTLLATTGDPALLRRVEQIARRDADPRIRRQAERIAQQNTRTWK